jgi:hypothetical protein
MRTPVEFDSVRNADYPPEFGEHISYVERHGGMRASRGLVEMLST